ncbi:unnamed protein product [Protopolystoma xenopodis]|uniref:NOMO-like N-terminal beta-sandwich domain-containing protein n=1 Tax=Protopolystoma xenopodis TaxID=117903 RepID=A0A448WHC0_9PLAT|nr:unnamed protein product [Protopolystoma xenopodis]
MSLIAFNLYIVACIAFHNAGGQELDNVIACGGFINLGNTVDSQLTYEELKIELQIDKHDIIKEVAEVLPNGAYSVPVYDAGQYRIRLYAPSGWIFHPSEGHVVTAGLETGPAGLFVTLINTEPPGLNIKTQTKSKGLFLLTPVPSGHYTILVGDSSEDIHKTTRAISEGHFLRGTVRERQGPELFADLRVILFAANKQTASSYFAHISKPCSSASNSSLGDIPHQYHVPEEILNSATAICEVRIT